MVNIERCIQGNKVRHYLYLYYIGGTRVTPFTAKIKRDLFSILILKTRIYNHYSYHMFIILFSNKIIINNNINPLKKC